MALFIENKLVYMGENWYRVQVMTDVFIDWQSIYQTTADIPIRPWGGLCLCICEKNDGGHILKVKSAWFCQFF